MADRVLDPPLYRHAECGWVGTESEMGGDYIAGTDDCDEIWSNCICGGCGAWLSLDDYERLPA